MVRWLVTGVVVGLLVGCQSLPSEAPPWVEQLDTERIDTSWHQHLIARQSASVGGEGSDRLHIYIEGDGIAWVGRYFVARDPTPENGLSLRLMRRDTRADALYLGRPCQFNQPRFGLDDRHCHPGDWASGRYSERVVASMTDALNQAVDWDKHREVVLIGHSGGGTLAMLIGHRLPRARVAGIVTIAANLDTREWTRHHGYTPLWGSLNPAAQITESDIPQAHWAGGQDEEVPPLVARAFTERLGYPLQVIDDNTHGRGWLELWPEALYDFLRESQ
ncbi:alpha/beta fold hydrolase [Marinimicrobium alkaliphilum]|uniref:alpha/beta fold hydrolase n=1 Tax=Marinimicrobium alkaliphilum TaxID=2202654 RepID=UPI000DBAA8B9|nr:alpha/beta hydrolase [Marinimicrobium alkaliphilum]